MLFFLGNLLSAWIQIEKLINGSLNQILASISSAQFRFFTQIYIYFLYGTIWREVRYHTEVNTEATKQRAYVSYTV